MISSDFLPFWGGKSKHSRLYYHRATTTISPVTPAIPLFIMMLIDINLLTATSFQKHATSPFLQRLPTPCAAGLPPSLPTWVSALVLAFFSKFLQLFRPVSIPAFPAILKEETPT
jgi:hypothetical protein